MAGDMAERHTPYGAFNFLVNFDGGETFGGFSDVSGIGTEITVAEYRNGNEKENHVRKVPGIHKISDVTLKRGIVNSKRCWTGSSRRAPRAPPRKKKASPSRCATRRRPGAELDARAA